MGSCILPLYFPLDQPTAIGVSPATSSYSGSRYYKHYSVQHLHLRGILISTSSFLPGFSPTSSRLNSAVSPAFRSPPFPTRVIHAGLDTNCLQCGVELSESAVICETHRCSKTQCEVQKSVTVGALWSNYWIVFLRLCDRRYLPSLPI